MTSSLVLMSREVITIYGAGSDKYHLEKCRVIRHKSEDRMKRRDEEYASTFWELCEVCREKERLRNQSPVGK